MSDTETIRLSRDQSTASAACWTSAEVEVPQQLGSVRLIRELGRGGMGVVWLGHDDMLDRDVAVKFLLGTSTTPDDPAFAGFLEGARAAAAVRHPGLATVYQVDVINGVPYLVMEYINGPTLAQVLVRHGPLSVPQALAIMRKVCEPIAELHDRGIVHRDIKPGNIMLNAAGEVFVTDFGLACDRVPQGASLAVKGLAGTPAYMAPEMFDGSISPRSDVYALGAMLFELLVGRSPFEGTVSQLQHDHASTPVPMESLLEKLVQDFLMSLIERAMNKNPMFRIKSARQFSLAFVTAAEAIGIGPCGDVEVAAILGKMTPHAPPDTAEQVTRTEPPSSYHEQLSHMALQKRQEAANTANSDALTERNIGEFGQRTLTVHVPCIHCEYDLHGVEAEATCPECGNLVSASLSPNRLCFAERGELQKVARACRFLHWTIVSFFVLFFSLSFIAATPENSWLRAMFLKMAFLIPIVYVVGLTASAALLLRMPSASLAIRLAALVPIIGFAALAWHLSNLIGLLPDRSLFIKGRVMAVACGASMIVPVVLWLISIMDPQNTTQLADYAIWSLILCTMILPPLFALCAARLRRAILAILAAAKRCK